MQNGWSGFFIYIIPSTWLSLECFASVFMEMSAYCFSEGQNSLTTSDLLGSYPPNESLPALDILTNRLTKPLSATPIWKESTGASKRAVKGGQNRKRVRRVDQLPYLLFFPSVSTFVNLDAGRVQAQVFHICICGQCAKYGFQCTIIPLFGKSGIHRLPGAIRLRQFPLLYWHAICAIFIFQTWPG